MPPASCASTSPATAPSISSDPVARHWWGSAARIQRSRGCASSPSLQGWGRGEQLYAVDDTPQLFLSSTGRRPLRPQQILGHTSLQMVRRYVAMANIQHSLIERQASPMDLIAPNASPNGLSRRVQPKRSHRVIS